jgi:hypothetical protein
MTRYKCICATCGSANVRRDAWAAGDVPTQSWHLASMFDAGFCEDCDGEAVVSKVAIEEPTPDQAKHRAGQEDG